MKNCTDELCENVHDLQKIILATCILTNARLIIVSGKPNQNEEGISFMIELSQSGLFASHSSSIFSIPSPIRSKSRNLRTSLAR